MSSKKEDEPPFIVWRFWPGAHESLRGKPIRWGKEQDVALGVEDLVVEGSGELGLGNGGGA